MYGAYDDPSLSGYEEETTVAAVESYLSPEVEARRGRNRGKNISKYFCNISKYFPIRRQERRQEAGKEEAIRPQSLPRIREQQLPSTLSLVISQSEASIWSAEISPGL